MAEKFQYVYGAPTAIGTITALNSLADGNIWQSGAISPGSPTPGLLQISYTLVLGATWAAGDTVYFWVVGSDGDGTTPFWPGGIAATQGAITTAATIINFLSAAAPPHHQDPGGTSHTTTFVGTFDVYDPKPNWQLLIRVVSNTIAASGNTVRYRYADRERITT